MRYSRGAATSGTPRVALGRQWPSAGSGRPTARSAGMEPVGKASLLTPMAFQLRTPDRAGSFSRVGSTGS